MWVQKKTNIQTNKHTNIHVLFWKTISGNQAKAHSQTLASCGYTSGQGHRSRGGGGGHGPHTIFKSMFWPPPPPHFWGQLAQVETISQSYIHRNTYIHMRSHTTPCTSTVSCGITSPPPRVLHNCQAIHCYTQKRL